MTSLPPYDFEIRYDETSVRAAAHTLFMQNQRRLMWFSIGSIVLPFAVAGGIYWWLHSSEFLWFPVGLLALQLVLLPLMHWDLRRRLLKVMVGGKARIRFDANTFSMESDSGSHVLPWSRFGFTRRDSRNLLLFLTRRTALIVPTESISEDALNFAIERVALANVSV